MTTAHLDLAQAFLEGKSLGQDDFDTLIKKLKADGQFTLGRRVLERALAAPELVGAGKKSADDFSTWVRQQRALCTYKNPEQPLVSRLRDALGMLNEIGLFDPENKDAETLGLGGAIYKRFWVQEGNIANLHAALSLYRAGWERGTTGDRPYCGVNAAFVLDQMAHLAERAAAGVGGDRSESERLRHQADELRRAILAYQETNECDANGGTPEGWILLTRAELLFGLGDYVGAREALKGVREKPPADWKVETCARQLIELARCQNVAPAPEPKETVARQAWDVLSELLDTDVDAVCGLLRGRVGLALSGGGFRASFYHLGVLARLAEADALRHVEVISTVSGGSIVGVLYYLEVKQLLETKSDLTISREDYVEIVRRIQTNFFNATSRNLRVRMLARLRSNLKMLLPGYSRSHRIGELFEDEIYSSVGGLGRRRVMPDLLINPAGHDPVREFKPNEENWRRRAKVPVLLINTTALNSGHNFQFTANWMGEPPGLVGAEIDMNARLQRLYYRDAPTEKLRCFPLGHAVAASACVPMIFDPLTLYGLYPGRTVRLVDGGVHDNQGVSGLLDESCTLILCSDASGQMHDESEPGDFLLGTAMRSSDIGQDRVREAQYEDLAMRERSGALGGLLFMHLKDGLDPPPIAPCGAPSGPVPAPQPNQTPYGIDRTIQLRLAELRTDLDSFTEVEAQCLMLSGYSATREQMRVQNERHLRKDGSGSWGQFDNDAPTGNWPFRHLEAIAAKPADSTDLRRRDLEFQLAVGKDLFFKGFKLVRGLRIFAAIMGLMLLAGLGWLIYANWSRSLVQLTVGEIVAAIAFTAAVAYVPLAKLLSPKTAVRGWMFKLGLVLGGWAVARLHLLIVEPRVRARGSMARLLRLPVEKKC